MAESADRLKQSRAALGELSRALERLEGTLAKRKGEKALAAELAAARSDYERLAGAARAVESRLDGVALRLKSVLQG